MNARKILLHKVLPSLLLMSVILSAYIVKKGDTLWDLSESFFKDPFAWPELWKKNPHIEDPHWIYPGDSLLISRSPSDTGWKDAKAPAPFIADSLLPENVSRSHSTGSREQDFLNKLGVLGAQDTLAQLDDSVQIPSNSKDQYWRQLAPQVQYLSIIWSEQKHPKDWGTPIIIGNDDKKTGTLPLIGTNLLVHAGNSSTTMKRNDLIYIFSQKEIKDYKSDKGIYLHQLAAIARVSQVGKTYSKAHLEKIFKNFTFHSIYALTSLPFSESNVKAYTTCDTTVFDSLASVIYQEDETPLPSTYTQVLVAQNPANLLDVADGVLFWENKQEEAELPPYLLGQGLVLHADKNYASILIRELHSVDRYIQKGSLVSVLHRAEK
jgi:hypothetical protein